MILTNKQEEGLKISVERYRHKERYTTIAGYAGVGKSTLIRFIISALDIPQDRVAYIAYTGKAAQVLRNKGCPNAMTAHKFLYKAYQQKDGTYKFFPREIPLVPCDVVVVDEVSMLPKDMWELLLSHNIYVIACGDPGQLPPIGESNGILEHPHVFLDQIMRQAQDNDIIRLSFDIREGKRIVPYKGQNVNIVPHNELIDGMFTWADQIICGKNATRYKINDFCRKNLWGDSYLKGPTIGDRVICLHNEWKTISDNFEPLINGTVGYIQDLNEFNSLYFHKGALIDFCSEDDDGLFRNLNIDWKLITEHKPSITKDNFRKIPKIFHPKLFDYGYCITAHKSQGSEYPKVLVIEEMLKQDEHRRWLYTACTRASEKLTLVLNR